MAEWSSSSSRSVTGARFIVSQICSNHSGRIAISSTILVDTPNCSSLSFSQSATPSIKSIGGAPSRVASRRASGEKVPVVMINRSEEHTSELQSLMRISYAVFCLKKKRLQYRAFTRPQNHTHQRMIHTPQSRSSTSKITYKANQQQ